MKDSKSRYEFYSRTNQQILDALIFGCAFVLAYQIRFAGRVPEGSEIQAWLLLAPVMLAELGVTRLFGIHRLVWRYIGLSDAVLIARSHAAFSAVLLATNFLAPEPWANVRIPRSVILIQFLLSLVAALGIRALRRIMFEAAGSAHRGTARRTRVILVGAGRAGVQVAKELASEGSIFPVGFLDDDPAIQGTTICGVPVRGAIEDLPEIVRQQHVEEVILCIARSQQKLLRRVWALCDPLSLRIRTVPALDEILSGKINITAFRDVEMGDLIGRDQAHLGMGEETQARYRGKCILITGAGGSIGSELAYQLSKLEPKQLVMLDKDENGLHEACLRIPAEGARVLLHPVVADLRFPERIRGIFSRFEPEIVFHAAAHKHVPLMEVNPCEAILNNVISTRQVVELSREFSVERFVLVSTDKAVKPTSIMGASKRVCEIIVQAMGRASEGHFCCVRFGNVLGSRGSVIPAFQKQIARGERLKITHADVERYLMTIPEAVALLIEAGAMGSSGATFVLDMGEPVLIMDLARRLIEQCGMRPGRDVAIDITQLRAGEKLSEQLFDEDTESLLPTRHEKVRLIQSPAVDAALFAAKLAALEEAAHEDRPQEIYRILRQLNIGFRTETRNPEVREEAAPAAVPELASGGRLFQAAKSA
ncbi:MAG: polysaccharide biosynthesis protein [Candidatus Acidiferrales bacterium]